MAVQDPQGVNDRDNAYYARVNHKKLPREEENRTEFLTTPLVPVAPSITGVPTISGTEQVGQTLTAVYAPSSGSPTPTDSGQWVNSVSGDIPGATSLTYVLQSSDAGDTITFRQTASNTSGPDATATSAPTGVIADLVVVPTITDVVVNDTLKTITMTVSDPSTLYAATSAPASTPGYDDIKNGTGAVTAPHGEVQTPQALITGSNVFNWEIDTSPDPTQMNFFAEHATGGQSTPINREAVEGVVAGGWSDDFEAYSVGALSNNTGYTDENASGTGQMEVVDDAGTKNVWMGGTGNRQFAVELAASLTGISSDNHYIASTFEPNTTASTCRSRIWARYVDANNYAFLQVNADGTWLLRSRGGGANTDRTDADGGTVTIASTGNNKIELRVTATDVEFWFNDSLHDSVGSNTIVGSSNLVRVGAQHQASFNSYRWTLYEAGNL